MIKLHKFLDGVQSLKKIPSRIESLIIREANGLTLGDINRQNFSSPNSYEQNYQTKIDCNKTGGSFSTIMTSHKINFRAFSKRI